MLRRTFLAGVSAGVTWPTLAAERLSFDTLYGPATAAGTALSAAAQAMVGQRVTVSGFMAPPLKADTDLFVLTRYPMSSCPFCSNAADWPVDIVLVRLSRAAVPVEPSAAIGVTGVLEAGAAVDAATGFVSLVRLTDASWRRL